jgi:hypothetical protein
MQPGAPFPDRFDLCMMFCLHFFPQFTMWPLRSLQSGQGKKLLLEVYGTILGAIVYLNPGISEAKILTLSIFCTRFGSVLSQYGVHSFPILFMHNRTARVRYYGPRNLEYLKRFYQNYTGKEFMALSSF